MKAAFFNDATQPDAVEMTSFEAAEFERHQEFAISQNLPHYSPDEIQYEANLASEFAYKVLDLRGRFCPADSNWDSSEKNLGVCIHYNGPPVGSSAYRDMIAWIAAITNMHKEPGRFSPGWTFNGIAYNEFVWGDTVYLLRNPNATLPHCNNLKWNYGSMAIHVPLGQGQRADALTLRTLTARTLDHLEVMKLGRGSVIGHMEAAASECPGSLMEDFVRPFRARRNPGGNPPKSTPKPDPVKPPPDPVVPVPWLPGVKRISFASYSEKELDSGDPFVLTLDGEERAAIVPKGMAFDVPKPGQSGANPGPIEPEPEKPADPKPSGAAKIIDDYFRSLRPAWSHVPYVPIGEIIVEEAKRAGIALQAACALVEQESAGRNVMGCDHGNVGDRPPYCHQAVTKERVAALRRSDKMNGVGVTQLTWHTFVTEAENMGGAHWPLNQMRVGFKLMHDYFSRFGELDGYGAYNAGEGNRVSVRHTYSAACVAKSRAWKSRLGTFAARDSLSDFHERPENKASEPCAYDMGASVGAWPSRCPRCDKTPLRGRCEKYPDRHEEEEMYPTYPEPKPKLSKAAKAIVAAAIPLIATLAMGFLTGEMNQEEVAILVTGLIAAVGVYATPNAVEE